MMCNKLFYETIKTLSTLTITQSGTVKGGVASVQCAYDRGRSFLPVYNAHRETFATFTTLNRTPAQGLLD